MKTRNLLIAALLLGGMTAFNSCSEKEIDNITPPIDQPVEEELETVFVMNAGYGDNLETRAGELEDPSNELEDPSKLSSDYEDVYNYSLAIFEANEGGVSDDSKILAYYAIKSETPIWTPAERGTGMGEETDYHNVHRGDQFGFYLMPQRFKTSAKHVAIVVVANSDVLDKSLIGPESSEVPTSISNFGQYVKYINTSKFPEPVSDGPAGVKYPMSSNVCVVAIEPGKYNAVGLGSAQSTYGMEKAQSVLKNWDSTIELTSENYKPTIEQRILLYRNWSQIELKEIDVKTYTKDATDAKFTLKEAFLMNVPVNGRMFDEMKIASGSGRTDLGKWASWGGALNLAGLTDLRSVEFYSGYSNDKNAEKESSTSLEDSKGEGVYDKYFRDQVIAAATTYADGYYRDLSAGDNIAIQGKKSIQSNSDGNDLAFFPGKNFSFIVNSGNYGVSYKPETLSEDYDPEKSIVLCIKGDYEEFVGNVWIKSEDRYYTVVVNDGGAVAEGGILSQEENIANTVVRNVKYDISLTVTGPGSDTPVGHLPYSYVVPKVTIVPFGHVTQHSEVD